MLADTILDITFLGYDLYRLATAENKCDFDEQLTAFKFDLIGTTLPFVTGLGTTYRYSNSLKRGLKNAPQPDIHYLDNLAKELPDELSEEVKKIEDALKKTKAETKVPSDIFIGKKWNPKEQIPKTKLEIILKTLELAIKVLKHMEDLL